MKQINLKGLIEKRKFDYVDTDIEANFELEEVRGEYRLFHFNRYISSEDAISEIEKEGYLPANATELLSWEDWNGTDSVIALGSVASVSGRRRVLSLWEFSSERSLHLCWFDRDWFVYCRFLAIKATVKPTASDIEHGELDEDFAKRFWSKVEKTEECWNWTAAKHGQGYGLIKKGDTSVRAHRISVLMSGREIPDGYNVDHLCRNTSCVRPDHLEVVTSKENTLRGNGITAQEARQTHCKREHEFTPENTRTDSGNHRHCLSCETVRKIGQALLDISNL